MERLPALHRRLLDGPPWGWLEGSLLALLVPLSWLYGLIGVVRIKLYDLGARAVYRAPVPVISIGNLAVGGTGKTPVVDHVTRFLLGRGRRVAIVSRGYGGSLRTGVHLVCAGHGPLLGPEQVGDEPYLLARRNPQALILTARRRADGVRKAVEDYGARVILLDDGFQHRAVARDLDVVLLDALRPFGNGWVLPAGALREFPRALRRGHLFLLTRCPEGLPPSLSLPGAVLHSRHRLADTALGLRHPPAPLAQLVGLRGVAFAGIADPPGFFEALRRRGLNLVKTLSFTDHCSYNEAELAHLRALAAEADYLITTEKDGVKLQEVEFSVPCYQVPLVLEFLDPGRLEQILESLLVPGEVDGPFPRTA